MRFSSLVMLLVAMFLVFSFGWVKTGAAAVFNVSTVNELRQALSEAQANGENDTIYLSPGTYLVTEPLTYESPDGDGGHHLEIIGAGANSTILDGDEVSRILLIDTDTDRNGGDNGSSVLLEGLSFLRGKSTGGGALKVYGADAFSISECVFQDNQAPHGLGGAVHLERVGSLVISSSRFLANVSPSGPGAVYGLKVGEVSFFNSTVSDNQGYEAAVNFVQGETAEFTENYFTGNQGGTVGPTALLLQNISSVHLYRNRFLTNGAYADNNVVAFSGVDQAFLVRNLWKDNQGSAVHAFMTDSLTIVNNIFAGNQATRGAGLEVLQSASNSFILTNNTFYNNRAERYGGAVYISGAFDHEQALNFYNNIFFENLAEAGGADGDEIYIRTDEDHDADPATVNIYYNLFSPGADFTSGQSQELYLTDPAHYSQAHNLNSDPVFMDPTNGNYHLAPTSPCIDAASDLAPAFPNEDFDGDPRPQGEAPDIGADEFRPGQLEVSLRVNGAHCPLVLHPDYPLVISISLEPGGTGGEGDYFLWAEIPGGSCYCFSYPMSWFPCACASPSPTYQGSLISLSDVEIFSGSCAGLPLGSYTIHFAVDPLKDGALSASSVQDSVTFEIR